MVNNSGQKVGFTWTVADLLRGPYKPAQVILPLTVLRRLDRYGEQPAVRRKKTPSKSSAAIAHTAVGDELRLSLETYLEDLIIEQWSDINFGADLFFVDRQMQCGDIGYLDILARDKATDGFMVIELKRDEGDDETFGQLSRYMGWIADNKDQPEGAPVRGIIVAAQIAPKLEAAAKTNPNVRLVEYAIRLELLPRERRHGH